LLQKFNEAKAACDDVVGMASKALQQRNHNLLLDPKACAAYMAHCQELMHGAAGKAAAAAIAALQLRLTGTSNVGNTLAADNLQGPATPDTKPVTSSSGPALLVLDAQLGFQGITIHPSVGEILSALSASVCGVLEAVQNLPVWTATGEAKRNGNKPDRLQSASAEVTAAASGIQKDVTKCTSSFEPFAFLWNTRKEDAYAAFAPGSPSMEEAELQIRQLVSLQQEIEAIPDILDITSAVCLQTTSLKYAMRAEIAAWKTQFAQKLHARAKTELKTLESRCQALSTQLGRQVKDIDDVAAVMVALQGAREEELGFEKQAIIVEEMYALLNR